MGDVRDAIRRAYESPYEAARRAQSGVVGIASPHVPQELIRAAGFFPVVLASDSRETTPAGDRFMEDFVDGPIRSLFDRAITGRFDFADLLVIPRCGEGFLQLYYYLLEARHWHDGAAGLRVELFDLLHTPFWTTGRYVRGRIEAFRATLEMLAGRRIEEAEIAAEIGATNAHRRLVMQVNALRRERPARLSGSDALRVFATAGWMERDRHTALLRSLLEDAEPVEGVRVMVKGSPYDNTDFYDLVESSGAVVVADDHLAGERLFAAQADETIEPIEALTQKYHLRVPSIRSYPQSAEDAAFLALIDAAAVQAVIFFHAEHDDTLGWDYPDQKRALDARGIPSVYLKQQSLRHPDVASQRAAVRHLLAQVDARVAA